MSGGTRRQREIFRVLGRLVPRVPYLDAQAILEMAQSRHLRHLPPSIAIWQATTARVRHAHTEYDALLEEGYDRDAARFFVIDHMNFVLTEWGCGRHIDPDDTDSGVIGND
ncbi:DUF2293 domain-containing protein [Rhizobiales bacterium]|uniref:DUF2293 domain-containing protein n=1 Tax=Hongsoonwoonella zoysiae TaxID=2821844 RepID=UPI00156122E5|nr:DUF2293 domain-containing protein [Hongsoonwoonella zoysiae]NRG17786.1 DUF2293 domain-containing protein [Hongsoonwoonella zoysiae]